MSFVKKAVKKVISTVKKIVKSKVFKIVAIAALTFFTAGVAAGGFAAFSGVSSIGGFFTAVGQTIATGASAIAGGLGFSGASGTLASYGGAAAEAAGLTAATGITNAAGVTLSGATLSGQATVGAGQAAGSGFLSSVKGVLGKKVFGEVTVGELASKGILGAVSRSSSGSGNKKRPKTYVAGQLSRGGTDKAPDAITYDVGPAQEAPPQEQQQVAQLEPGTSQDVGQEQTLAATMAQGKETTPPAQNRIQQLIQERGPINQPGYDNAGPQYVGGSQQQSLAGLAQYLPQQQQQGQSRRVFNDQATRIPFGGGLV